MHEQLLKLILKRDKSLFAQDMEEHRRDLLSQITGARILIIGAAGSIGSAFVKQVAPCQPATLHLVDLSENNLVELVRDLRSSGMEVPADFKTFAIGMGTPEFEVFLKAQDSYDYVVNFAAMKHVRSERDPYTLMRMVHTNVCSVKLLMDELRERKCKRFFSVSSDKAVVSASFMGATKCFMELVMRAGSDAVPFSTARFANVAFSEGSLLQGFENRLMKRQPLAAPNDVRRYFISHQEAGELCLLACFLGDNRDVFFPNLDSELDMLTFSEIACLLLEARGLTPRLCATEEEARRMAAGLDDASRAWPCFFSESNTAGEKMYEEFFTEDDDVDLSAYRRVGIVHEPRMDKATVALVDSAVSDLLRLRATKLWNAKQITDLIELVVPELQHTESGLNLDQKM